MITQSAQKVFCIDQVVGLDILVELQLIGFNQTRSPRDLNLSGIAHFCKRSNLQCAWMGTNLERIIIRGASDFCQIIELLTKLLTGDGDMSEPYVEFITSVQATQINVSRAVSEPASHLHQCVIHLGCAEEITDGKTFEGQSSGKLVSTDGDYRNTCFFVFIV